MVYVGINIASRVTAVACCVCALHVAIAVNTHYVRCHSLYRLRVVLDTIFRRGQCAFC